MIQQKLRRVGLYLDVTQVFIRFGVDDANFSVVFTGILPTVSDIQKSGVRIVRDTVGPQIELDRVHQVKRVAAEHPEHSVISTGHKQLVEGWNIGNALRLLKT